MIARYTHPEMGRIWSDQRRYETWLLRRNGRGGGHGRAPVIVPKDAARDIRERAQFDSPGSTRSNGRRNTT